MKKHTKRENIVYLLITIILILAPIISSLIRHSNDENAPFEWSSIFRAWLTCLPFFVFFLIHNYLVAPLLVYKRQRWTYVALMVVMLTLFQLVQCSQRPEQPPHHFQHSEMPPPAEHHGDMMERPRPPVFIGEHDVVAFLIILLTIGMNLGVKIYFKSEEDEEKMATLQRKNLEKQLEYLTYQINPHFFMNTLNNIHALVDIAPEQAKATILELSKLMRYMLYDGSKGYVPLSKEIEFLHHYITLMRLRYTDKVNIETDIPEHVPEVQIAPLLLITFVENAFKHGISYQKPSFVNIHIDVTENRFHFTCRNSKTEHVQKEKGGVGLEIVRQRLNLIYGTNHELKTEDRKEDYFVDLTIQLSTNDTNT